MILSLWLYYYWPHFESIFKSAKRKLGSATKAQSRFQFHFLFRFRLFYFIFEHL